MYTLRNVFNFDIKKILILFLLIISAVSVGQKKLKLHSSKYDSSYHELLVANALPESTKLQKSLEGSHPSIAAEQVGQKKSLHELLIKRFMELRQTWGTSPLGAMLFLGEDPPKPTFKQKFIVLIWKYYDHLKTRYIKNFGSTLKDPLQFCSVNNCNFTGDNATLSTADAVVIHIQHGLIPEVHNRDPSQIWVFLTDESPRTFAALSTNYERWKLFAGQFNWSMTYRAESDIPVPYGRVIPLPKRINSSLTKIIPNWDQKRFDVRVTVLVSNCLKKRMQYINELSKYVQVDIYGKCSNRSKKSCPGHLRTDCKSIDNYLFYLAFENSKCKQYITEKAYHNAISKGAVPIIMGSSTYDCDRLLPPGSYLHVDNYNSPKELADHILHLSKDMNKYLSYHEWRRHFEVLNEHGFFKTQSKHYCRICEALNYNSESQKTYNLESLASFLDPKKLCD